MSQNYTLTIVKVVNLDIYIYIHTYIHTYIHMGFLGTLLVAQTVKNLPAMQKTWF